MSPDCRITSRPHKLLGVARWTASPITSLPRVSDGESDDPIWYPLQHGLGIDTFGANVLVASRANQTLVEEHDEDASGQQELYVVLEGEAIFKLDSEHARLEKGAALAVSDPSVRRSARALTPGTVLLIIGAGDEPFRSTWNPTHFRDIPRPS
jgi:quercetin dioxygenase-like cupin family protein